MRIAHRSAGLLVLVEGGSAATLSGLVALGFAVLLIGIVVIRAWMARDSSPNEGLTLALGLLFAGASGFTGVRILRGSTTTQVTFDAEAGLVKRTVVGRTRQDVERVELRRIAGVEFSSVAESGTDFHLVLDDGSRFRLGSPPFGGEAAHLAVRQWLEAWSNRQPRGSSSQ